MQPPICSFATKLRTVHDKNIMSTLKLSNACLAGQPHKRLRYDEDVSGDGRQDYEDMLIRNDTENQRYISDRVQEKRPRIIASNVLALEKLAWLGEDKKTRTSSRASSLDKEPNLFPGISTIDDCARSLNSFFLVRSFEFPIKYTFSSMVSLMARFQIVTDQNDFEKWANFKSIKGNGRSKNQRAFWEYAFYEDRRDEHYRLKWSLAHPSRHFTQQALDDSWQGVRNSFGHIQMPRCLRTRNSPHIFGIVEAK